MVLKGLFWGSPRVFLCFSRVFLGFSHRFRRFLIVVLSFPRVFLRFPMVSRVFISLPCFPSLLRAAGSKTLE